MRYPQTFCWHDIRDYLPQYDYPVLLIGTPAYEEKRKVMIGCRNSTDRHGEHFSVNMKNVTHWTSIPELPNED